MDFNTVIRVATSWKVIGGLFAGGATLVFIAKYRETKSEW